MEPTPNLLDLGLLILLVFFFVKALVRGFVREAFGLIGAVIAVVVSAIFYQGLASLLAGISGVDSNWWGAVAFGLILLVVFGMFLWIGGLAHRLIKSGPFSGLDRALGGLVGLAKGVLISYLLINLLLLMTPFTVISPLKQSVMAPYVVQGGRYLVDFFPGDLVRNLQERAGLVPPAAKDKE